MSEILLALQLEQNLFPLLRQARTYVLWETYNNHIHQRQPSSLTMISIKED